MYFRQKSNEPRNYRIWPFALAILLVGSSGTLQIAEANTLPTLMPADKPFLAQELENDKVEIESTEEEIDAEALPEVAEVETLKSSVPDDDAIVDDDEDNLESSSAWSGSLNIGSGTSMVIFHPTEYVRSYGRSMALSMGASARYRISNTMSASAGLGGAYHMINPQDLSGRRFWFSDPSLRLSHSNIIPWADLAGIGVSGSLGASVGLSPSSRYWSRYGSLSGSVSSSRAFGESGFRLGWTLSSGLSFSKYTSPLTSKYSDDGLNMALARADGSELLAGQYNLVAGNAQLASIGNTLSLSAPSYRGISTSLSLGVGHSYRYCPPIDHLSSEAVDHYGDKIVRQSDICRSDSLSGSFGFSYQLPDKFSLSASLNTNQPLFSYSDSSLTESSRVLRFPWWDRNLHLTSLSMSVSRAF